ncbi:ATP-dependent DNA helicase RecG [Pseudemcibacter aquimaris]|uniref:ATP-dependent DNA helicase RecG n=1 Tax=Pseudemcibacter aquimaris TaxID=2857064 RepID=UPI002013360C|nr:ATP-dependent DNA helicase RecG [Pseudemcibacter aquimaris]MCC3860633.1 ATP-dependent DNA helicase RecG [Pseudemcibacter aquimaris]WDU59452.1 ATP-dependent DNA helicase RecG [Pseudemcibacter aquimaris]
MRPEILYPLFTDTQSLPGVGARVAQSLEKITGNRILDLLWHLPVDVIDRRNTPALKDILFDQVVTVEVTVGKHDPAPAKSRKPYRVWCHDDTGQMQLVFFHPRRDYIQRQLPEGEKRLISGKIEIFNGALQMSHPEYMVTPDKKDEIPPIEPIYPLTAGISAKVMAKIMKEAVKKAVELPEWIDETLLAREGWPAWYPSLMGCHNPENKNDTEINTSAHLRLAYDEILANQLALEIMRRQVKKKKGRPLENKGFLTNVVIEKLPYALTDAQSRSIKEIMADMAESSAMMRLLQGDVGSGKTVVALIAMLVAVENETQAAILAPTEILARQHYESLTEMASGVDVNIAILTGRDKGKAREKILADLASGEIDILIGTHAIFQKDVIYHDLAMAVIDEQHRFGVEQRMMLAAKGKQGISMDVLAMTATPIPRTLTLTVYGDMDVSRLDQKPPGRTPVDTRVMALNRIDEVVSAANRAIQTGARLYWVCPLVEESEVIDLAAAEERFRHLTQVFGDRVGMVHGKMKAAEKDDVMQKFASGDLDILVATTVIEVGVNVPEATVMIIEHAERFGLSQLHQLRGRVGRGADKSTCLLLYGNLLGEVAKSRLNIMRETEDGFVIAEEDLKLRGAGEVLGTRQSGLPKFRVASMEDHHHLIPMARDDARLILEKDADLSSERGKALRTLLYLFERDEGVKYLKSG